MFLHLFLHVAIRLKNKSNCLLLQSFKTSLLPTAVTKRESGTFIQPWPPSVLSATLPELTSRWHPKPSSLCCIKASVHWTRRPPTSRSTWWINEVHRTGKWVKLQWFLQSSPLTWHPVIQTDLLLLTVMKTRCTRATRGEEGETAVESGALMELT